MVRSSSRASSNTRLSRSQSGRDGWQQSDSEAGSFRHRLHRTRQRFGSLPEVLRQDKASLTAEQRRVVSEVSQTVTEAGGTIRVKLHDKMSAIDKLGRHLGMFKDGNGDTPPPNVTNITRIERLIVYPPNTDAGGVPAATGKAKVQGS
jgi:hypothetical protein